MKLQIEGLNKHYRSVHAVRDLTLDLGPGVLGLLGPNGAGKSTLMRMLASVTKPSSGTIRLDGVNVSTSPDALRRTLGYLPQDFGIYPHLSADEFLEYIGALKGVARRSLRPRIDHLLEVLNLSDVRSRALGGFSGGMRQRVGIAQALLNDPRLLIVDEPTAGLDPQERVRLRTLLAEMSADRIIIFSTHICSDVESIATRVAIVDRGTLLADDAPSRLAPGSVSLEDAYLRIVSGARTAA
ncbi:MAG TPA: ATP-binding cassette domain-containing protein [Candidatus Cybelea sp.]|jgi:ABC-type multidrug transport system ATPase subunit|nr:ATP-binding cassette domain-containing protein [Candidatus Cybelea sp.]